jgi:hypothetical protein
MSTTNEKTLSFPAASSPAHRGLGDYVDASAATCDSGDRRVHHEHRASLYVSLGKNAAGNVYGFRFVNTTATIYYLRMYNASSAPTCSSGTGFVESIPIPASTSGAGFAFLEPMGEAYTTGIGFCLTGGSSSTDNTNAAVGVFGTILYK